MNKAPPSLFAPLLSLRCRRLQRRLPGSPLWTLVTALALTFGCTAPRIVTGEELAQGFHEHGGAPCSERGLALFLQGLNNHPGVMNPLSDIVAEEGLATRSLTIAGNNSDRHGASVPRWREETDSLLEEAVKLCPHKPLLLVGYSTGALLWIDAVERLTRQSRASLPHHSALLLFAPPLVLRPYLRVSSILAAPLLLSPLKISIPTRVPPEAQASPYISLRSFQAFFTLYGLVRNREQKQLPSLPALVLLAPDDELVASSAVKDYIERHGDARWEARTVADLAERGTYLHLFVLPSHAGEKGWVHIQQAVRQFITAIHYGAS